MIESREFDSGQQIHKKIETGPPANVGGPYNSMVLLGLMDFVDQDFPILLR